MNVSTTMLEHDGDVVPCVPLNEVAAVLKMDEEELRAACASMKVRALKERGHLYIPTSEFARLKKERGL